MSDELPQGWVSTSLATIAEAQMGETILAKQLTPAGIPVFSAGEENNPWGFLENPRKPHGKGTVVVSARGSIGFPKIPKAERFASTQTTIALRFPDEELATYGCLWLKTVNWSALTKGAAIPMLTVGDINQIEVPLAPLAEQRRIVAKLEKLLGQVDACRQRLEKLPALLKRFRQSVLAVACSGRLTADWREENPDTEPASLLLKRIASQFGKTLITCNVNELPFDIPSSWQSIQASDLCRPRTIITYGVLKPVWVKDGVPTVRVQDMKHGKILVDQVAQCCPERAKKFSKTTLETGDLLIAKDGATLGKTAFVPPELDGGNITQHVLRFPISHLVESVFVHLIIDSRHGQDWMRNETRGAALPGVNVGDFRRMPIPLPPLAEQQEIVRRVAGLFALADQLEQRLAQARKQVDKLTPSLLARAFVGKLVPQNPTDEPAEKLLERIKSNHESKSRRDLRK